MKVICVNNKNHNNKICPFIEVGDEVTVCDGKLHDGEYWYQFAEYPPQLINGANYIFWYDAASFAIIPDQSADEMQEQEREAIVNLETA